MPVASDNTCAIYLHNGVPIACILDSYKILRTKGILPVIYLDSQIQLEKRMTLRGKGRGSRSPSSPEVSLLIFKVLQWQLSIVSTVLSIACLFHSFFLVLHFLFPLLYADSLSQLSVLLSFFQ